MDMTNLTRSTFVLLAAVAVAAPALAQGKKNPAEEAVLLGQFGDWDA